MNQQFEGYILLHNIAKPKNMGTIIRYLFHSISKSRNAAAFNFKKVFLIGKNDSKKKFQVAEGYQFFGSHGTQQQMEFQTFETLKQAKEYFTSNKIIVCGIAHSQQHNKGVEICEQSEPVQKNPFKGNTVFFLGNEGSGLIDAHKQICDHFIYIPQYTNKTASLNVSVASGIIFHHFALWAGYQEMKIFREKFQDKEQLLKERIEKQKIEGEKIREERQKLKDEKSKNNQNDNDNEDINIF